jgi:quinolinate synthase
MDYIKTMIAEINALRKERNAVILAHNYQRDEVQEIADHCGDSLALSQIAADSGADVIVFCGVHFMAESAAILAPQKTVLLPNMEAGCPMADMITAEKLIKKKKELNGIPIVCYVNTSADVKAESDICCTSANAVRVVESLDSDEVYMIPDMNLSQYVQRKTKKKVSFWKGFCPTHQYLKAADILKLKASHPGAPFVAHPECPPDVLDLADDVRSTSGMYDFAKRSSAKKILVGTEMGILYRLRKENPDKEFVLASRDLICPNMKVTTLEDVRDSLRDMKHRVVVAEPILSRARKSLDRMLSVPRD